MEEIFDDLRDALNAFPCEHTEVWLGQRVRDILVRADLSAAESRRIVAAVGERTLRELVMDPRGRALESLDRNDAWTLSAVADEDFDLYEDTVHAGQSVRDREFDADEDACTRRGALPAMHAPTSAANDGEASALVPPHDLPSLEAWAREHAIHERLGDPATTAIRDPLTDQVVWTNPKVLRTVRDLLTVPAAKLNVVGRSKDARVAAVRDAARLYLATCALRAREEDRLRERNAALDASPVHPALQKLDAELAALLVVPTTARPRGTFVSGIARFETQPTRIVYEEADIPGRRPVELASIPLPADPPVVFGARRTLQIDPTIRACAIQAARSMLRDETAREAILSWAKVPAWTRTLAAIDEVIAKPSSAQAPLGFRVKQTRGGLVTVVPLHIANEKGKVKLTEARVSRISRIGLEEADERVFEALSIVDYMHTQRETAHALEALVGHPRAYVERRTVRVVREAVRLTLAPHEAGHRLAFEIGDRIVRPTALLDAMVGDRIAAFLDRADAGLVSIARVSRDIASLARAMAQHPADFPDEAHGELLARFERIAPQIEVALPTALTGDAIAPDERCVIRVDAGAFPVLVVSLRLRPLAHAAAQVPGEGATSVHGRDPSGKLVHTVRDLARERAIAEDMVAALGLAAGSRVDDEPFSFEARNARVSGEILASVRALEAEGSIVVEWAAGSPRVSTVGRKDLRMRIVERRDWFGVGGEVEIDGTELALAMLLEASRRKERFVVVGGGRLVELESELRARLEALDDHVRTARDGALELATTAAPALAELIADPTALDAAPSFARVLGRLRDAASHEPAVPAAVAPVLRPYQREGHAWLSRLASWGAGGCLADDMGLGKTLQAIALLHERGDEGPALVVAPTSVVGNWVSELARFGEGLRAVLYRGADRGAVLATLGARDILVTNYDVATRDVEELAAIHFATLIVDEAQALKNAQTLRAKAVRRLDAEVRFALTGTPVENHLGELWSIFRVACPGLLGSWEWFRERFALPIEQRGDRDAREALTRLLRPFLLRRTKEAVAPELPPITEIVRTIELGPSERAAYEAARLAAVNAMTSMAAGGEAPTERFAALAALMKLRRLACHPRLVDTRSTASSAKLSTARAIIDEIVESGHRALVFSQFTDHLALLREALDAAKIGYQYLDGSTPAAARTARVEAFQRGECPLFLISLRAGGTGLNLTGADYVLHLDPWWNPAVEDQATDRAHRIGQTRAVTVVRLVTRGTIEEAVLALHAQKRALAEGILDGADAAARLSTSELIDLVRAAPAPRDAPEVETPENETELARETEPRAERPSGFSAPPAATIGTSGEDLARLRDLFCAYLDRLGYRDVAGTGRAYRRTFDRLAERIRTKGGHVGQVRLDEAIDDYIAAAGTDGIPRSEGVIARTALRHFERALIATSPR